MSPQLVESPSDATGRMSENKARRDALRGRLAMLADLPTVDVEAVSKERFESWVEFHRVENPVEREVYAQAAAATTLLHRCWRELEVARARSIDRAEDFWDEERALEAAELADRLPKNPAKIAPRLRLSLRGARLMVERWSALETRLEANAEWSAGQRDLALDLLGVPAVLRDSYTPLDLDDEPGSDAEALRAHRLRIVRNEIESLRRLIDDKLIRRDADDREMSLTHSILTGDREVRRLEQYERNLSARASRAIKQICDLRSVYGPREPLVEALRPAAPTPRPEVASIVATGPAPARRAVDPPSSLSEETMDEILREPLPPRPDLASLTRAMANHLLPPKGRAEIVRGLLNLDEKFGGIMTSAERVEGQTLLTELTVRITPEKPDRA